MSTLRSHGWADRGRYLSIPRLLAIMLIVVAFWMAATRAVALEMHTHPPVWVVNTIPAALSELYFGHPKRYTILTSVQERFVDRLSATHVSSKSINPAIRRVAEMDRAKVGDGYVLLGADDKGIVDLIKLGFVVFGFRAESVTTAYFAILLVSCLVYAAAFWRSPSRLLLVASLLAMLYLVLPMVAYNGQLHSILALRALPVLSMVACLHCLLFMVGSLRDRVGVGQIILVAVQVGLIAFTLHLRSTTIWQIVTILGVGIVVLVVARLRPFGAGPVNWRSTGLAVGSTAGLIVAGYLGLRAYQALALPEEYHRGDEIATRAFWHNIFSGLAFHPDFAERYQLRIDDSSIFAATRDYLAETGRLDVWREIGGEVPGFAGINYAKYDPVAGEMLLARCSTYLRECAEATLYYKPVALVGNLAWLYGLREHPPNLEVVVSRSFGEAGAQVQRQYLAATYWMDQRGQRAYLWTPIVLLVIMPFAMLLACEPRSSIWTAFAGSIGLTLGSTIPTVIGYPVAHTILEPAIAFGMLTYLGVCLAAVIWLPGRLTQRRQPTEDQDILPLPTSARRRSKAAPRTALPG